MVAFEIVNEYITVVEGASGVIGVNPVILFASKNAQKVHFLLAFNKRKSKF